MRLVSYIGYCCRAFRDYWYDAHCFLKSSMYMGYATSERKFLGRITLSAHVVEKGLTMPQMRLGFGQPNLHALIDLCQTYAQHYDVSQTLFRSAIGVIKEYDAVHQQHAFALPQELQQKIHQIHTQFPQIPATSQPTVQKSEMFAHQDFYYCAHHRHSVRQFHGKVSEDALQNALLLASTAPSACNRQPVRIHVVDHGPLLQQILSLQNGNRGFGNTADKILVVTSDYATYANLNERNAMYIDGGIYVMNLLYALQYYAISACTLNCSNSTQDSKRIKQLLHTHDALIAILAIGDCGDSITTTLSERIPTNEYVINHKG